MKVLAVFVAVALFAQSALCSWAPYHGAYAHGGYQGPLAKPVATPSGFLADTPEVAAAKAAHLSEVSKASTHAAAAPAEGYAGAGYAGGYAGGYHGPLAKPVVLPSGFLADTPEVAAAKSAHLKLAAGASYGGYAGAYAGSYDDGSYKGEGSYDDGSYKGEGAYAAAPVAPVAPWTGAYTGAYDDGSYKGEGAYAAAPVAPVAPWTGAYAGAYDDGSYKGEGAYAAAPVAPVAHGDDDGSYKPYLYEHGHY